MKVAQGCMHADQRLRIRECRVDSVKNDAAVGTTLRKVKKAVRYYT